MTNVRTVGVPCLRRYACAAGLDSTEVLRLGAPIRRLCMSLDIRDETPMLAALTEFATILISFVVLTAAKRHVTDGDRPRSAR
jgi:hypothetical protein